MRRNRTAGLQARVSKKRSLFLGVGGRLWCGRARPHPPNQGGVVIRQAISCDICAAEKRQTNHWFVAYEQGGELRVSGWTSRHRLRPGSKHLCGQTCLHKLVDEFMAKSIAVRARRADESDELEELPESARNLSAPSPSPANDTSLTSPAGFVEEPSSARLLTTAVVAPAVMPVAVYQPSEPKAASSGDSTQLPDESRAGSLGNPVIQPTDADLPPVSRPASDLLTMPPRPRDIIMPVPAETLRYASRRWRAEAWERERERELRALENRPALTERRRSSASSF